MEYEQFDHKLAEECAQAFFKATGVGCMLTDNKGKIFLDFGFSCTSCRLCQIAGLAHEQCVNAHLYGMAEAERFGGKYIYFCPMGLTCFVSPIFGECGTEAKITAGPFIMVEKQDFIDCELRENAQLTPQTLELAVEMMDEIPYFTPEHVNALSTLLFMAVGFMNNVSAENRMLNEESSGALQGQITSYILELKRGDSLRPYPFETERALLQSISRQDNREAQRLLNELLGAILFTDGYHLEEVKTRVYELLVMVLRTAVEHGAETGRTLSLSHEYRKAIAMFSSVEQLSFWLSKVIDELIRDCFSYSDTKHANLIHRCTQYIGTHYNERLTIEDIAQMLYISPTHLGRIFKQETGVSFNHYLNRVRINKAKNLLHNRELRLTDISQMVGYEDQSYFTKVFKQHTGVLPKVYREHHFK